jgi:hypothetical protein
MLHSFEDVGGVVLGLLMFCRQSSILALETGCVACFACALLLPFGSLQTPANKFNKLRHFSCKNTTECQQRIAIDTGRCDGENKMEMRASALASAAACSCFN